MEYYKKNGIECGSRIINLNSNNGLKPISVQLYPNPCQLSLQVEGINKGKYSIVDFIGKTIQTGNIQDLINLSHIASGVYTFYIDSGGMYYSTKLIKE